MRKPLRSRAVLVVVAAAAGLIAAQALAAGSIVAVGASIDSGAGTPKGKVFVSPSAPLAPAPVFDERDLPPAMGSMSGAIAAFSGPSSASASFSATSDTSLAAGTHTFTSFSVDAGVTVTCQGAVTIEVVGDADLAGSVVSSASGASITFVVVGDLTMTGSSTIATSGASAPISLDVAGALTTSVGTSQRATIHAASGDVVLVQHGTATALTLSRIDVAADAGRVDVRSAFALQIADGTSTLTSSGDTDLRAYGSGISIAYANVTAGGALRVEASTRIDLRQTVVQSGGALDLAAFSGRIEGFQSVSVSTAQVAAGDLVLRANDHVIFYGTTAIRHRGTGDLRIESINADVQFYAPGRTTRAFDVVHEGTGDVLLREGGMLVTHGIGAISAAHGDLRIHAFFVESNGDTDLAAPERLLDLRSTIGARFRFDQYNSLSGTPTLAGGTIRFSVKDVVSIQTDGVQAGAGGLRIAATQIFLRGTVRSEGPIVVGTTQGTLDVAGADVRTTTVAGAASAPIRIEQFAGDGATIDATGATIRSGDAAGQASGDVSVLVHVPGGTDPVPEPTPEPTPEPEPDPEPEPGPQPYIVDGLVVVQSAHAVAPSAGATTRIDVHGFLDTGAAAASLDGTMKVTVGEDVRTIDLAPGVLGVRRFHNPSLALELRPSPRRSSRVPFRLHWTGDASAFLDAVGSGQFDLRFESAALHAGTAVRLDRGRFRIGRAPEDVFEPRIALLSADVRPGQGPEDRVALTIQFATIGASLASPPDVSVAVGDRFAALVPASAFEAQRHGRFVAREPADGVDRAEFDAARGTLRIWARGIEFGTFPDDDPVQVDLALRFGTDDVRFQRLRLGWRGSRLVY